MGAYQGLRQMSSALVRVRRNVLLPRVAGSGGAMATSASVRVPRVQRAFRRGRYLALSQDVSRRVDMGTDTWRPLYGYLVYSSRTALLCSHQFAHRFYRFQKMLHSSTLFKYALQSVKRDTALLYAFAASKGLS